MPRRKYTIRMFAVSLRKRGVDAVYSFPWKVSIVAFMANPPVLKEDIQALKETFSTLSSDRFFDVIEVQLLGDEAWRAVEGFVKASGVEVASGVQPLVLMQGFNPSSLVEAERKKAVSKLVEVVKTSAERGISKVAFSSGPDPGPENREAAKDALIKSLKEIAGEAKKFGVTVILETFDRDWDKKQLIGPIREAVEVAESVREEHGNFGLLWDLSHAPMLGEKPSDLKLAKSYLAHIHIGCAKRLPDGRLVDWHPGFYRPGAVNGVEDVKELLKVLLEIGYTGAVGFEVKPEEGQHWREPVEAAKGVLYEAFLRLVESEL
ncbi:Xylose isomerase domain protein TIM barrel [Thermofilum pendens Hrk 5]|uniref:Xylose isomerase domain protein TIM barrel n=2 Tax=Thermofilum pendens TaxID=2269 RepID=A1RYG0_THEPD|nr:Xylose isomerase domain protein TIM barrel [Thermofilum pendens Hrk 5]